MTLATLNQAAAFGYDADTVAPMLYRAEARVRSYLRGRSSASAVLSAASGVPEDSQAALAEVVFSVANRMANTMPQVVAGAVSEGSGGEQVTFGAQAYAGTSDLTDAEKRVLDRIAPKLPFTAVLKGPSASGCSW